MLVISCHADTCFREHRLKRYPDGGVLGHLDNFVGVHAVMTAYFSGGLPTRGIRIELTYGEEKGCIGAYEVMKTLSEEDVVVVVDVTGTPTDKDIVIEKCSHPKLSELIRRSLEGMEYDLYAGCPDPVLSADETEIYSRKCPMTCFLGIPVRGGDYSQGPVFCAARSIGSAAEALRRIAQGWAGEQLANE
jgi:hypothetical protein